MIRRILNLIVALSTIAVSATAQTLSVSSIETELGAQTEIVVNVEGASEITALQFTLNLPDGVSLSYLKGNCGMYLGDATNEHVMSVSPLSDGGRFIMIYSTDLNTFSDGVLLRIPVKMPAEVCSENGSFSDICFSTVNADSRECSDVAFTATSKLPEVRTEFEVNGIHYVFLENYYGEEGLSVWVTSTGGYVLSDDEENTYSGDITIPGVVTYGNVQYPVVGIRSEAFAKCTINSLTLAEGVKYLVPYNYGTCFGYDNTTKIKEVYLPSTFTISRKDAFVNEANGLRFFPGDMGLEKIVIADENPEFDSRNNCNAIIETATNTLWDGCKGTVIPSSVETIGAMAFFGSDIEECIIPEGVKKIQGNAFVQCANLQKVVIPTSVDEVVGSELFLGCTNLKTVEIPQTTLIRSAIGYEGDGEASGTKAIPASMFSGCSSLQEFVIPNDVVYIGAGAFRNCQSLSSITIPSGVTTIGGLAFRSCEGLRSVTLLSQVPPTVKESSFMNLYEQITLNVPEGAEEAYKQHEVWGKFFKEEEDEPEGLLTGKNYRVKNVTTGLYLQVEGNNTNMKLQNKAEGVALMQVFQLEEAAEGKYYIKAADSDNNYYAHASGWNFNATTNADNKTPFTIALVEGETQVYTLHQNVSANTGLAGTDDAAAGAAIYCDKGIDNNGKWTFEPLTEEENAIYVTTLTATAKAALDAAIARGEEVVSTRSAVLTAEEVAAISGAVQAAKESKDAATEVAALKALSDAIHTAVDAAIYVWSIDEVSNTLCYAVSTEDRGAWYAQATHLTSTTKAGVAVDVTDKQQLFAFVQSPETGALYLYSVSEEKFVKAEGGYTALTEAPEQTISILNGTRSAAFPWVVALNAEDSQKQMGISNGYDPAVITHWNDLGDGGNTVRIEKAAAFDATAALAAIKALETGINNSEFIIHNSELIYDLQGRRVTHPTKGSYILGGRKVVIK